jgi:hypothetical protein
MSITKSELGTLARKNRGRGINAEDVVQILRSNNIVVMSWGTEKLTGFGSPSFYSGNNNIADGFGFKVNGRLHKGWVLITVNSLDLFDIYLTAPQLKFGSTEGMKPTVSDVFIEDLMETLDYLIETPKEELINA